MTLSRRTLLFTLALVPGWAAAQASSSAAENTLRSSIDEYLSAWARRDVEAWLKLQTDDALYVDPYLNEKKGREQLAVYIQSAMRLYDLRLDVERIVLRPDGKEAFVVFHEHYGELPRNDGRYTREYERSGIFSRWRLESGVWRVSQFIDSIVRSQEYLKAEGL